MPESASSKQAYLKRIDTFYPWVDMTCEMFQLNSPQRLSIFIAQLAHESGRFRYVKELASGDAYDTRTDLGNTPQVDGDGAKYKGRGLIQITGTANYTKLEAYFHQPFLAHPELLEVPEWAAKSAGWFWMTKNLNTYCDQPNFTKVFKGKTYNQFEWITLLINGGQNGLEDRLRYYTQAKKAFGI